MNRMVTRVLLESILFSLGIHVLYIGVNLAIGWISDLGYEPSIINTYENVTLLEQNVSHVIVLTGIPYSLTLSFVLIMIFYVVLRYLFLRKRK